MKQIVRDFAGTRLTIDLTEEEIKEIINEYAVIGFRLSAQPTQPIVEPEPVAEPKLPKEYTMPKVIRTGCLKDHKDEAIEMIRSGKSQGEVAAYFGVSISTLKNWLKQWVKDEDALPASAFRPKGITLADGLKMLDMFDRGIGYYQIANTFGVSDATVNYWLRKARAAKAAA